MSTTSTISLPPELGRVRAACMALQEAMAAAAVAVHDMPTDDPEWADWLTGLRYELEDEASSPAGILIWLTRTADWLQGWRPPPDDDVHLIE